MITKEEAIAQIKKLQSDNKSISTAYFTVGNDECAIQRVSVEIISDYNSGKYHFGIRYIEYQAIPKTERDKISLMRFDSADEAKLSICERAEKINNLFLTI